ncbi:MAG: hypothetical protein JO165_07955 [Candidatus Eremiobacteraeota bacterium]|nr:hypothetical protein [Candidatus Eremiobacteraeota bacterium]
MVDRIQVPGGYHYRVTPAGFKSYFDGNRFKNNPDHVHYFCYTHVAPVRVLSIHRNGATFRVSFTWHESDADPWARDNFIRSHSVVLAPITGPATATFVRNAGANDAEDLWSFPWTLKTLHAGADELPHVIDASVWLTSPRRPAGRSPI